MAVDCRSFRALSVRERASSVVRIDALAATGGAPACHGLGDCLVSFLYSHF